MVKFETVATLHQCALFEGEEDEQTDSGAGDGGDQPSASFHWEVLEYGMPVVIANSDGVALCLADIESGDKICEFPLWSSSQYVTVDDHFHILAEPSGCYGISYDDGAIGEKVLVLLKRAVSCPSFMGREDGQEPSPKQQKIEADSTDGGDEDVIDGPFGRRKLRQARSLEISEPKDFEHISHVGADTSISELTQAMSWTDTLKRRRRRRGGDERPIGIPVYNCKEVDTVSTSSFVEVFSSPPGPPAPPPGPPPPPAPPPPTVAAPPAKVVLKKKHSASSSVGVNKDVLSSLANEIKKGVVLRPVGSDRSSYGSRRSSDKSYDSLQDELKGGVVLKSVSSNKVMTLPPPPRRTESEKLLFEITTFRRTRLRTVTASSTNMTDFPSAASNTKDKSLESVMKKGLDTMMKKISGLGIPTVVSVGNDGSDNFDGLFVTSE